MIIREIQELQAVHFDLLLLADPDKHLVENYVKRSVCFEAIFNGTEAGILALLPTRPETLEIVNIAVAKTYQGQGIGEKLLQFALSYAKNSQYKTVEIGTGSTSFGQLYLYQKCGFRMTSIDRDFFLRHYEEEIVENKLILKDMVRLSIDV
ncbi:ribosomal protein S18 acetylase RimI-like enzyme [Enterococcus rotai]|uniref:GNAT family acetyltransferase n=1 Tax=Enterococcus rotai TaxID=118060 RepID=A0A0U2VRS2_9ENTE|nr:GNAT family N-acetyltransferase [Enterococcus rotai]ALS37087.1 GNAT family acetyltransferase [Enterococcus rotai]